MSSLFVVRKLHLFFGSLHHSKFEPRQEKIYLRGFRPGRTQTGLYSHRRWIELCNFRIYEVDGLYYICSENKGADQLRSYFLRS